MTLHETGILLAGEKGHPFGPDMRNTPNPGFELRRHHLDSTLPGNRKFHAQDLQAENGRCSASDRPDIDLDLNKEGLRRYSTVMAPP